MCDFIPLHREKEKVVKQKGGKRQRRKTGRHTVKEQEKYHCAECVCVCSTSGVCVLHLSDGFRQVGGYFTQSLPSAVHDVVTAGAGLWAL